MGAGQRHSRSRGVSDDPHFRQLPHAQAWRAAGDAGHACGGRPDRDCRCACRFRACWRAEDRGRADRRRRTGNSSCSSSGNSRRPRREIAALEQENRDLTLRLAEIAALAGSRDAPTVSVATPRPTPEAKRPRPERAVSADPASSNGLHPAARKLLVALAQHAPARFTWGQAATLAGKAERRAFQCWAEEPAGRRLCRRGGRPRCDYAGGTRGGGRGAALALDTGRAARLVVRPPPSVGA